MAARKIPRARKRPMSGPIMRRYSRVKILLVLDTRMLAAASRSSSVCEKPPFSLAPAEHADRSPRGDDEGDGQREEHRGTCANGNGTHVWSHQAADKGHRQNSQNDRKGSKNCRIANFADCLNRDERPASSTVVREVKVPHDVFHDNDGVINQNADAEDEGEEGDPIERETQQVKDQQRERERGGYGNRDNQRFAPSQQKEDEQ